VIEKKNIKLRERFAIYISRRNNIKKKPLISSNKRQEVCNKFYYTREKAKKLNKRVLIRAEPP